MYLFPDAEVSSLPQNNSKDVEIIYSKDLTLGKLLSCFQKAGSIIATRIVSETFTTQTIILSFEKEDHAKMVEQEKDLWFLERHLETDELTTNVTEETTLPRVKSEIHVVSHHSNATKIDEYRVFCQLPWAAKRLTPKDRTKAERLIDESFFQHFAQFGPMEYYYTVKDRSDRLSHGFVRYFNPYDALRALHLSKRGYRARTGIQQ